MFVLLRRVSCWSSPGASPLLMIRLGCGHDPELSQEMARVPVDPAVNNLAVLALGDGAPVRLSTPVRRGDSHQITPMGSRRCVAGHHIVSTHSLHCTVAGPPKSVSLGSLGCTSPSSD